MKKENRQMAQERRAEERKRLELKKKRNKFLKIAVPIVLILLLVIVLIVDGIQSSDSGAVQNKSDNSVSEATVTNRYTYSISLQTDASLTVEDGDTVNIDYVGKIDGQSLKAEAPTEWEQILSSVQEATLTILRIS